MRLRRIPAPTRKAPCPVLKVLRLRRATTASAGNSPVAAPTCASLCPASRSDSPCSASSASDTRARPFSFTSPLTSLPIERLLEVVLLDLRQKRLVADAEVFGRARLVAVVRAKRAGDLA